MDWVRGEELGHGSFAKVNLAIPRSENPFFPPLMAVKSCGVSLSSSLKSEKLILDELEGCPEVIQCFGERFSCENGEKLYNVLLEYAPGGSLADKLKNSDNNRGLPEFEIRRYTKSLLKGLRYIHKSGYVHCDIKLQNILLGSDGNIKIADFGLAKRTGSKKTGVCGFELRGTPLYMSPEVVNGGDHGFPADIWALGCAVAEMAGGSPPWSFESDLAALLMRIGVGEEVPEIPAGFSHEGKDFLMKCFVKDSNQRWTAEMLLDHPFVVCDDDLDRSVVYEKKVLTTPRCVFEFPDWVSSSITSLSSPEYSRESSGLWFTEESRCISAAERLRKLVSEEGPDWSVSGDWVTVR